MCILKGVQGQCKPNAQKTMDIASLLACSKLLRRSLFSRVIFQNRPQRYNFLRTQPNKMHKNSPFVHKA